VALFTMIKKILKFGFFSLYYPVSRVFLKLERVVLWRENRFWLDNTPRGVFKGIAFETYTGWMHYQGYFCALADMLLDRTNLKVLDFGCGMGRCAPVFQFYVKDGGKYLGVDTDPRPLAQCRETYRDLKNCEFFLTRDDNAFYKKTGAEKNETPRAEWPVQNGSQDVLISISVFTHLQEEESAFYMNKIHEVLAPGGMAIITFHVVRNFVHPDPTFNFTTRLTPGWYTSDPECPEHAIAVDNSAIQKLIAGKFTIQKWLEGSSTGGKNSCFQDLLVLKKI
jgi:SAM-dependent methyltransferase